MLRSILISVVVTALLESPVVAQTAWHSDESVWDSRTAGYTSCQFDGLTPGDILTTQCSGVTFSSTNANEPHVNEALPGTIEPSKSPPNNMQVRSGTLGGGDWKAQFDSVVEGVGFWVWDLECVNFPDSKVVLETQTVGSIEKNICEIHPSSSGQAWNFIGVTSGDGIVSIKVIMQASGGDSGDFVVFDDLRIATHGQLCPPSQWCQWTIAEGGNGHWYRSTSSRSTWDDAELAAVQLGGHLVTINGADENTWLTQKFPFQDTDLDIDYWIGFYQDTSDATYSEPSGGWKWIGDQDLCRWSTGNPDVCYTSWNVGSGEPNNLSQPDGEQYARLSWGPFAQGGWTDHFGAFWFGIMERDTDPFAIPAASEWGMIMLTLLILTAGTVVLSRTRIRSAC